MHPDIEHLLKLQEVDEQLMELERSKEYLPEIIANVRGRWRTHVTPWPTRSDCSPSRS